MSDPTRNPPRWTRAAAPAGRSVVTFPEPPVLFVTVRRGPGSDAAATPGVAARVVAAVSELEEAHGGRGLLNDPDGSVAGPAGLVLRLFPKLVDAGAAARLVRVAEELTDLVRRAADATAQGIRESRPGLSEAVAGVEQVAVA